MIATVASVGFATVQDGGRTGYASVGVPTAGAWHRGRYTSLSELLTGAEDQTLPSIELLAGELVLVIDEPTMVAVSGPADVRVNDRRAAPDVVLAVTGDGRVSVRTADRGPVYVGVSGWEPARTLGSCSVDTFSRLGGRPLAAGDELDGSGRITDRVGWFLRPEQRPTGAVGVVMPAGAAGDEFCARSWQVVSCARSGTRLRSNARLPASGALDSFPVLPGAVQVTPDGEAIVLGPDGGLTGGYPVIAVVATAHLDRISAVAPGDEVRFAAIDRTRAARAFAEAEVARLRRLVDPSQLA